MSDYKHCVDAAIKRVKQDIESICDELLETPEDKYISDDVVYNLDI